MLNAPSDKISHSDRYETQLLNRATFIPILTLDTYIKKISKIKINMKIKSCTCCISKLQLQLQIEFYVSENNGLLERLSDGEVVLSKASVSASDSMEVAAVS